MQSGKGPGGTFKKPTALRSSGFCPQPISSEGVLVLFYAAGGATCELRERGASKTVQQGSGVYKH